MMGLVPLRVLRHVLSNPQALCTECQILSLELTDLLITELVCWALLHVLHAVFEEPNSQQQTLWLSLMC